MQEFIPACICQIATKRYQNYSFSLLLYKKANVKNGYA
ncbi:hypothetical protein ADICYQ_4800 [Cyclobacterium qasimii M12-11B]|uniref:Uncharacterized protein n=1 Tax=Cyclobacterium qasimii M12-11B TaxID=641524 RepID=S7V941_9BACT|nr:hypothetical protein ADICYQ_4800 [Cyclobacterium qasimii M12-11B]